MSHKKSIQDAPASPRKVKKTYAQRRLEKKQAKEAVLPLHKRPIVLPPDKARRRLAFRVCGYLCRAWVIWAATAGLATFVSSAMEFQVANAYILGFSLLAVALCALFAYGRTQGILATGLAAMLAVWKMLTVPHLMPDIGNSLLSLYNACLDRLYRVGYLSYISYKVEIHSPTATEDLHKLGISLLVLLLAALFTFSLIRRVRLIPPAVLSTTFLVTILTFNIYSNRIQTNLGIVLVLVSFASILVMFAYDRMYRVRDNRTYDTDMILFEEDQRPSLPEAYQAELAAKAAKKAAKAARRHRKHANAEEVTLEQELDSYLTPKRASATSATPLSAQERAAARKAKRDVMKQVRAVKQYDRITDFAQGAMGGFMSAAAMLVCLLAIAIPAIFIKGNFSTIEAIDEKMAFARDYVTAVLRGDERTLDELEYKANGENFRDRPTSLEQLEFTGKQIFYVQTRYNTNYYMTGWVGTNYQNGSWTAVDDDTLAAYRALFGTDGNPGEQMRYQFYHYMKPSLVDQEEYNSSLLSKYKSNLDYGFVNVLFHARRVNSPSSVTYFPATFAPQFGVFAYGETTQSPLTYINYFDGIRTGRKFKSNKASYATVTYAPVMTNGDWSQRVGALASSYTLQKEALLIRSFIPENRFTIENASASPLFLTVYDNGDGTTLFNFTPQDKKDTRSFRFYHNTSSVRKSAGEYIITVPEGSLHIGVLAGHVYAVSLEGCANETNPHLLYQYDASMTDQERTLLMDHMLLDWQYSDFVYNTYTKPGESVLIAALAERILDQLHTAPVISQSGNSIFISQGHAVQLPLATVRNATSADAVSQRDLLVRNVIDYIIDELGCTYTITPDLSAVDATLDGVENFLTNTHEGYCVQFASAVALILREYGIPARYVEGYIATGLERQSSKDFIYGGYVHDYEAHAWVEVFYDGLGWIQYETTPQYYVGMYGASGVGSLLPTPPPLFEEETKDPLDTEASPETTPPDPDDTTPEESESSGMGGDDENVDPRILRALGIASVIFLLFGGLLMVISHILRKAREAEQHRQSLAEQILSEHYGLHTSEEDRREMALEMSDAVTTLLHLYGLKPQPGEFREAYADRLTAELTANASDEHGQASAVDVPLPDLHLVLEGMSAEEFGNGMTIGEMKHVAHLYLWLHQERKHYLSFPERLHLHYIKRMI